MNITRPAILQQFSPKLCFGLTGSDIDIRNLDLPQLKHMAIECAKLGGPTGLANLSKIQAVIAKTVFHVSKDLSQDMEVCSFDGDFRYEYFPAKSGVILWEDGSLPSVAYTVENSTDGGVGCCFTVDAIAGWGTPETTSHVFSFPLDKWKDILSGRASIGHIASVLPHLDKPLTDDENAGMAYLIRLLAKVFTFAANDYERVEQLKVVSREEKKKIGIHPKHDYGIKAVSVRYLPRILAERDAQAAEVLREAESTNRKFLGRAGYVRLYSHERYTKMRGKTQYIWPIPAPEGYKVVYKIRKPSPNVS